MTDNASEEGSSFARAGAPSIVEHFGIYGLYGYRSLSLSSPCAATILIAGNGAGKTTLLGALDAFLRLQFHRLVDLDFNYMTCKLRNTDELVLPRSTIQSFLEVDPESELARVSRRTDVTPASILRYITEDWRMVASRSSGDSSTRSSLLRHYDFSSRKLSSQLSLVWADLLKRHVTIASIVETVERVLDGYELVYLPTYRRIELALRGGDADSPGKRKKPKFDLGISSLYTSDIQFGLSDISERLRDMNSQVVLESNVRYRELSANIINELIDGSIERSASIHREKPTREELELFFARLESSSERVGQYPVSAPDIDKIYRTSDEQTESGRFLTYFLNQLAQVINATRNVERSVQDFIDSSNRYLSMPEPSAHGPDDFVSESNSDTKVLKLNRRDLSVHIERVVDNRRIDMDALSSGEKQIISLFSRVFLYHGAKIILIDEPELSLSIDWQRRILADVLSSSRCAQVIAITHSPFIFDNELEPFARSLELRLQPELIPDPIELFSEEEEEDVSLDDILGQQHIHE